MQMLKQWRLSDFHRAIHSRRTSLARAMHLLALCIVVACLAACGKSSPTQVSASASAQTSQNSDSYNASLALQPASGYGGLYVQVSGTDWPRTMLVLVTLEDANGRSETLAASDTDAEGNLTTGFLFPIDQRWLTSESPWIVTTSADGTIEAKAQFTVVAPGSEVAMTSPLTISSDATAGSGATKPVTGTDAVAAKTETAEEVEEGFANTLVLPLISSAGFERSGRDARNSGGVGDVAQVDVGIEPGGSKSIDCRNGNEWITIAIYSDGGFDATSVDPGSVVVSGGGELGYVGDSATRLIALHDRSKQAPTARSRQAYQWRWHLEDVDGDGATDMVLEFSLGYTELTCDATVVSVTGRTKDGKRFEGANRVDMLVLERG